MSDFEARAVIARLTTRLARLEAVVARISECGARQFPAPDCRVCGEFLGLVHECTPPAAEEVAPGPSQEGDR